MSQTRTRSAAAKRPPPPPARRLPVLWIVIGGVAVALLVVGILLSMDTEPNSSNASEFATAEITGDPLPRFDSDAALDPAVGTTAPEVAGVSFDGSGVGIASGTPQAILFLAHWCSHCQAEVPAVQDWLDAGGLPDGVALVSVATSTNASQPNYPPSAWLAREGWTPPVIVDDSAGSIAGAFGLPAFPYWVFTDADGTVVARWAGGLPTSALEGIVAGLAAGS